MIDTLKQVLCLVKLGVRILLMVVLCYAASLMSSFEDCLSLGGKVIVKAGLVFPYIALYGDEVLGFNLNRMQLLLVIGARLA